MLSITLAGHLLLVFLGATTCLLSLLSLQKENHFGHPLGGIFWFFLAVICLYAMVLLGEYLDKTRALNRVSNHAEATSPVDCNHNLPEVDCWEETPVPQGDNTGWQI